MRISDWSSDVCSSDLTSKEALAKALDYIAQLRKTPIVVNDSRGFYTSRVFQTLIHEGGALLEEGIPPAVIENADKEVGMPVGPQALLAGMPFEMPRHIVETVIREKGDNTNPPPRE